MVNEFSAFARMPEPSLKFESLKAQIQDAVFLQKQAHSDIDISLRVIGEQDYYALLDAQQIRQAVNNLLQNAIDSVKESGGAGQIDVLIDQHDSEEVFVAVTDNGSGLPQNEAAEQLTEPYVTHKPKGTGLGLAIVKKIMQDHNGTLSMGAPDWIENHSNWKDLGGACVVLGLPLAQQEQVAV